MDVSGHVAALASMVGNVEVSEERVPILFVYRRERADSGGPGRFRGGVGLETAFMPHKNDAPIVDVILGAGRSHPAAHGLAGGYPAAIHTSFILRSSNARELFATGRIPVSDEELSCERREELEAKQTTILGDNDVHVFLVTGGGGYGDPTRRPPERVAADVRQGLVSAAAARSTYGVVLRDGSVDGDATARAREEIRRERLTSARRLGPDEERTLESGRLLHPVGDTVEAVESGGERHIRCTVCHRRLASYTEDFKQRSALREYSIVELTPINVHGLVDEIVAREFSCPGCGTLVALDIQRRDEPLLPEARFGRPA
jgi:N-methylhydantoinase B